MSGRKQKGSGATQNNSITLDQRVKLFDWCKAKKQEDDKRPFPELAVAATADLGFTVSTNCIANHWNAVNGRRRTIRGPRGPYKTLRDRVSHLEWRVAECMQILVDMGATFDVYYKTPTLEAKP